MILEQSLWGGSAKLRLSLALLMMALVGSGCRGGKSEVSATPRSKVDPSESAPAAPSKDRPDDASFARDDTAKRAREFGMVGRLSAEAVGGPEQAPPERVAKPAPVPAPSPRPAAAPRSHGDTNKGGLGVGLLSLRGGGIGAGQAFGAGHGRLSGSHRAAPTVRMNTESYAHQAENEFVSAKEQPLSTFSADVDTASYSNVRRFLRDGTLPPPSAVRIEEMLNYFDYEYPLPSADTPFGVYTEVTEAPWDKEHRLVHIGLKTAELEQAQVPPRNLVFLLDVSGSMHSPDKLPLLQRSMELLVRNLRAQDEVAIVVYAGASGVLLGPTSGDRQSEISAALERLRAGGSTNGAAGIQQAYSLAHTSFKKGGINRVVLATDGDFNVGTTSQGELVDLIEKERKGGVFLTILGFGRGNLKDSTMELLADKGNGNYAYIDSLSEARKVLVEESGATLVTVAKDVKFQVEFNPEVVESYRLVGYENRMLAAQDFNDDTKDAGEMGAGHTVTALYEVVPVGAPSGVAPTDPLKYQTARASSKNTQELATLKLRYKTPQEKKSTKFEYIVSSQTTPLKSADAEHRFATAVAEFGLVLTESKNAGRASLTTARQQALGALGAQPNPTRMELVQLIETAERLRTKRP